MTGSSARRQPHRTSAYVAAACRCASTARQQKQEHEQRKLHRQAREKQLQHKQERQDQETEHERHQQQEEEESCCTAAPCGAAGSGRADSACASAALVPFGATASAAAAAAAPSARDACSAPAPAAGAGVCGLTAASAAVAAYCGSPRRAVRCCSPAAAGTPTGSSRTVGGRNSSSSEGRGASSGSGDAGSNSGKTSGMNNSSSRCTGTKGREKATNSSGNRRNSSGNRRYCSSGNREFCTTCRSSSSTECCKRRDLHWCCASTPCLSCSRGLETVVDRVNLKTPARACSGESSQLKSRGRGGHPVLLLVAVVLAAGVRYAQVLQRHQQQQQCHWQPQTQRWFQQEDWQRQTDWLQQERQQEQGEVRQQERQQQGKWQQHQQEWHKQRQRQQQARLGIATIRCCSSGSNSSVFPVLYGATAVPLHREAAHELHSKVDHHSRQQRSSSSSTDAAAEEKLHQPPRAADRSESPPNHTHRVSGEQNFGLPRFDAASFSGGAAGDGTAAEGARAVRAAAGGTAAAAAYGVTDAAAAEATAAAAGAVENAAPAADVDTRVLPALPRATTPTASTGDAIQQQAPAEAEDEHQQRLKLEDLEEKGREQLYKEYLRRGLSGGPLVALLASKPPGSRLQQQQALVSTDDVAYSHSPACPALLRSVPRRSGRRNASSGLLLKPQQQQFERQHAKETGETSRADTATQKRFAAADACPPIHAVRPFFGPEPSAASDSAQKVRRKLPPFHLPEDAAEQATKGKTAALLEASKKGSSRAARGWRPPLIDVPAADKRVSSPAAATASRFSSLPHPHASAALSSTAEDAARTTGSDARGSDSSSSSAGRDASRRPQEHPSAGRGDPVSLVSSPGAPLHTHATGASAVTAAEAATEELPGDVIFRGPSFTTMIIRQAHKEQRAAADRNSSSSLLEEAAAAPRGATSSASAAVVPVQIRSGLQEELDRECARLRNDQRVYMLARQVAGELRCYDAQELRFDRSGVGCVDSCGAPLACYGDPGNGTNYVRLDVDLQSPARKLRYCVNSRLQAVYNELCGAPQFVWRVIEGEGTCVNVESVVWSRADSVCMDDCNGRDQCYGVPSIRATRVALPEEKLARAAEQSKQLCPCDEAFTRENRYWGCQTVTRTGRTCQAWNKQSPHQHADLRNATHNYCRNPYGEADIWCYTTDPDMRYDYCDPLGLKLGFVQPNETVDVLARGVGLDPNAVLRVYEVADSVEDCAALPSNAAAFTTTSFAVSDDGAAGGQLAREKMPEHTFSDGRVSSVTWRNLHVRRNASGNLLFCACTFSYLDGLKLQKELPCSKTGQYTVTIGRTRVVGPVYPPPTRTVLDTLDTVEVEIAGLDLTTKDTLMLLAGSSSTGCVMPNFFALHQEMFGNVHMENINAFRKNLEKSDSIYLRSSFSSVAPGGRKARVMPFSVSVTGDFSLCWKGATTTDSSAYGLAALLRITGVDTNQTYNAVYAPSVDGYNQRLFTLFLHTYVDTEQFRDDAVTVRMVHEEECKGTVLGRSHKVVPVQQYAVGADQDKRTYKALQLHLQDVRDREGNYVEYTEVCVFRGEEAAGQTVHLGYAVVSEYYYYPFTDFVRPRELHSRSPDSVYTFQVEQFSVLGLHWGALDNTDSEFLGPMKPLFFDGAFPKALMFWVDTEAGLITLWSVELIDLAPTLLAVLRVATPVAVALNVTHKVARLYTLREGPPVLEVYDVTGLRNISKENTVRTLPQEESGFVTPCCLALIYPEDTDTGDPLIVVLDSGAGMIAVLSSDLKLLQRVNSVEGMHAPFRKPKALHCIRSRTSKSRERTQLWDCFIADQGVPRIVYLRVNASTGDLAFVTEYVGEGTKDGVDTRLEVPTHVVAHYYAGKMLIYAAEEKSPFPLLLTKDDEEDSVHFYAYLTQNTEGFSTVDHLSLLDLSSVADSLENIWLASVRSDWKGPHLQVVSLDSTATVANFRYYPHEWYAVGETHTLEPSVIGLGSLKGVRSFVLGTDVPNAAYVSSIVTVDEHTGTVKLAIRSIQRMEVEVQVVAVGIVSQLKSTFSFKVACKDGYFASLGMCTKCPAGTYNSLTLIKAEPRDRWARCQDCKEHHTTVAEGSVSVEQCQCQKGYHKEEGVANAVCEPCPAGTWKHTVANTGCLGPSCPPHSSTTVVGATTPEERRCECEPGYYFVGDSLQNQECRKVETGFYSLGGFNAARLPCPMNTSTNVVEGREEVASSLAACICEAGFTAASAERLGDPNSAESRLMKWLTANPVYATLQPWQVCVRCPRHMYKDTLGPQACTPCPAHSFASVEGAGSKSYCDMCSPGYYQTGNIDLPCAECPKDHFCVGSETALTGLAVYGGKKIPCPANSETVPPNNENDHPFKCMCQPGYVFDYVDVSSSMVVCTPTRVGEYKDIISNVHGVKCPAESSTRTTGSVSLEDCICTVGHYFDEDTYMCKPCPVGYYCPGGRNPDTGEHTGALMCPPETNTTGRRSASIADCLCDKGFYRFSLQVNPGETVVCRPCPANTYKGWVGNDVCKTCSENSGTEETGANSAAQCLCTRGYYYDVKLAECVACSDPLKYCPGGQVDCEPSDPDCVNGKKPGQPQPCPEHTRITPGYDTPWSLDDCKCDRGFAYKGGDALVGAKRCEACAPGTYKSSVQDSNCNGLCGTSSTSLPGAKTQSQCFCEEGTYFAADACHVCPVGAICHGGLLEEAQAKLKEDPSFTAITSAYHVKPFAEAGYFLNKLREELESPTDWQFTQCPIRNACLLHGVCSETMTEYLCSECKYGYTNTFTKGDICTACPSMAWNISFIFGYYLASLMFNIVMTYMNVAAGFNRRSIHSIVIKIASNYLTCISVLGVIDMNNIGFPSWVTNLTTSVAEQVAAKQRSRWMSVDCLLREGFDLTFSDSFFYTMLFYTLVPIALPILVTIIMFIIVQRVHVRYRKSIQRKLDLLRQTEQYGLFTLNQQLREKFEEDRVFMIFRYIPMPEESRFKRFKKFMEDMIPIYVTVLFFVYTSTTRHMLSLLDCTYIDFGRVHKAKYFLRAAMSVQCDVSLNSPYLKFFVLGIAGICVWSIGIPLVCFLVLYINRKNLNSRETRLKYGFLHNGFVKKYWYWEMVVFARKFLVIVVSSVVIIPTDNMNGSRIWLSVVIAVVFLLFHLKTQPFDKRSYLTLDRLENHSMGIWTFTLIVMAMMIGSGFDGNINVALLLFLAVLTLLFFLEVTFSLVFAYFDNVRAQQTFFTVPVIGYLFRFFARLSEKRRAREPIVIYDVDNELIQLVAAKRQTWNLFRARNKNINLAERNYFIKVMAETLGFAVVHMKLDVIPGSFLEFALRLGMTFHRMEEDSQRNKKSLQAIAEGDLSHLVDWSKQEQEKKERTSAVEEAKKAMARKMNSFYKILERKMEDEEERTRPATTDPEEKEERLRDCDGEFADEEELADEMSGSPRAAADEEAEADKALHIQALASIQNMTEEEQEETMCLFDSEMMSNGIALSELYLALLKLQLKDSRAISQQFAAFKAQKQVMADEYSNMLMQKNRKLKVIREVLQTLLVSSGAELASLGLSQEAYEKKKEELEDLTAEIERVNAKLERLREHPEEFTGAPEEEWLDEEAEKEFEALQEDEERKKEQETVQAATAKETFFPTDPAEEAAIYSDSDMEEGENDAAKNLKGRSFQLIGFDADTWETA